MTISLPLSCTVCQRILRLLISSVGEPSVIPNILINLQKSVNVKN